MDLARKTAFDVLLEVEKENAYSNLALNRFIGESKPQNPAFVRELVYGVLENRTLLDYYLDKLIPSGIKKVKKKEKVILRMGLYQLMFMDSVPEYAAVNESVAMAGKLCRGREGFINGVLRGYMRRKGEILLPDKEADFREYLSVKYSFPYEIIDMWLKEYGREGCEKILEASNQRPEMSIRVNIMKTDVETLKEQLLNDGFEVSDGKFSSRSIRVKGSGLLEIDLYKDGMFSVQDEASTATADLLGPEPGDNVIDVCAAPGGKTAAIAEMMNNEGSVIACDIYEHKLDIIREQAERLGLTAVETRLLDGRQGSTNLNGFADKILVDAPCSGLGVIRRKPEIKYKENMGFSELVEIQRDILSRAAEYLKEGGVMVYSTCTVNREENQGQIEKFLKNHREFKLISQRQFLPTEDIDGFFACKMKKESC